MISTMESESEESKRFHLLPTLLMTPSLTIQRKPDCRSQKQKPKDKPITMHVPMLCDWFSSSASACDFHLIVNDGVVSRIRTLFSLDRVTQSIKRSLNVTQFENCTAAQKVSDQISTISLIKGSSIFSLSISFLLRFPNSKKDFLRIFPAPD